VRSSQAETFEGGDRCQGKHPRENREPIGSGPGVAGAALGNPGPGYAFPSGMIRPGGWSAPEGRGTWERLGNSQSSPYRTRSPCRYHTPPDASSGTSSPPIDHNPCLLRCRGTLGARQNHSSYCPSYHEDDRSTDSAVSSYSSHRHPLRRLKYFPVGDTSLSLGLSRRRLPQVRIPINDLYPVRIAFHALPDAQGSIIERARDERNHFQGSGPVGARVPRVAAKGATRG